MRKSYKQETLQVSDYINLPITELVVHEDYNEDVFMMLAEILPMESFSFLQKYEMAGRFNALSWTNQDILRRIMTRFENGENVDGFIDDMFENNRQRFCNREHV